MRLVMRGLRLVAHCRFLATALVLLVCLAMGRLAAQTAPGAPTAVPHAAPAATPAAAVSFTPALVHLTAEQDHQRLMGLLEIKELRPGEEKDANWDEAKANVYPNLPDPLMEKSGKPVKTAEEWWKERRPEIVEDYDREVLGRTPANLPRVTWEVVSTTREKN